MVEKEASSLPPAVVPLGIQAFDASSTMATLSADLVETACALESRFSALLAVLEEKLYRDFAALQVQLSGLSLEVASCKVHDDMARLLVPTGSSPSLPGLAGCGMEVELPITSVRAAAVPSMPISSEDHTVLEAKAPLVSGYSAASATWDSLGDSMRELSSKMAKCEQEMDALDSSRDLLNHADTFDQTSWDKLTKQMERATCRRESLAETIEEKVRQRASLVQFGMHNAADVLAAAEDPASDLKHVMARLSAA